MGETGVEGRFLAVRELAQQLDIIIDQQQRLGTSVQDIPSEERQSVMLGQDRLICGFVGLNRKIDPALALSLAIQARLWDNLDDVSTLWSLSPWCSSNDLDYSFEQYASRRTGRDPATLTNWIRTADLWLLQKIGPGGEVALIDPKTGQAILEQSNGETKPIMKKWDPLFPDFSKLLLVNKQAQEGTLDEVGYGLLMNPATRWTDMRDYIHNLMPWRKREIREGELKFFVQAGLLWASDGIKSEIICELPMDSDSMLIRTAVAKIIRSLSISIRT